MRKDLKDVVDTILDVDQFVMSNLDNNVILGFWRVFINLPSGKRGLLLCIDLETTSRLIFVPNYSLLHYMLRHNIPYPIDKYVFATSCNELSASLKKINWLLLIEGIGYDAVSYNLVIHSCKPKIQLSTRFTFGEQIDPLIGDLYLLAQQISLQTSDEEFRNFIEEWKLYVKVIG